MKGQNQFQTYDFAIVVECSSLVGAAHIMRVCAHMGVFSRTTWQQLQQTKPIIVKIEIIQRLPVMKKSSAIVQIPTPQVGVIDLMQTLLYFESRITPVATITQNWNRQTKAVK